MNYITNSLVLSEINESELSLLLSDYVIKVLCILY